MFIIYVLNDSGNIALTLLHIFVQTSQQRINKFAAYGQQYRKTVYMRVVRGIPGFWYIFVYSYTLENKLLRKSIFLIQGNSFPCLVS
jgi:hypothetical protein